MPNKKNKSGFTLIELSIVLVIIGLIAGGILLGQDLIAAARVRSQISQIQQYQTAVNTFKVKYGYLPGDMASAAKAAYGFSDYASDGNGIIDQGGYWGNKGFSGEPNTFWINLYEAGLTEFNPLLANYNTGITTNIQSYLPSAKIGDGKYVYVQGSVPGCASLQADYNNYFLISGVNRVGGGSPLGYWGTPSQNDISENISVIDAYNMDTKIDDGLPLSGKVKAIRISQVGCGTVLNLLQNNATTGSATTCFDKRGNASNTAAYSINQNGGSGTNCAIAFQFQ